MGYSSTTAALDTVRRIEKKLGKAFSNDLDGKGFWEIGQEQHDGAITGSVVRNCADKPGYVIKAGSFRIEPNGTITRFPLIPKALWAELGSKS